MEDDLKVEDKLNLKKQNGYGMALVISIITAQLNI
jgi:hypothetical protein